jgi:hypothetical protein
MDIFEQSLENYIILVIDKTHPKYGEIGKVLYYDWAEFGYIDVIFSDGIEDSFYDGKLMDDPNTKIKIFNRDFEENRDIRKNDKRKNIKRREEPGLEKFFQEYFLNFSGELEILKPQYKLLFKEDLPITKGNNQRILAYKKDL